MKAYDPFYGPLFQATNGDLYGTTLYGPSSRCYGTIFSIADGMGPLVKTVPVAGKVGKQVIILGTGSKGSTSVKFNGKSASFHVVSDTEILDHEWRFIFSDCDSSQHHEMIGITVPNGWRNIAISLIEPVSGRPGSGQ